jgi:hypothetical protein
LVIIRAREAAAAQEAATPTAFKPFKDVFGDSAVGAASGGHST